MSKNTRTQSKIQPTIQVTLLLLSGAQFVAMVTVLIRG